MATFQVNELTGYGPIQSTCWQSKWWNPWSWKSTAWRSRDTGGHAYVMVGNTMVKELRGKVKEGPYVFTCDAPDGDVWTICLDGCVCKVVRID